MNLEAVGVGTDCGSSGWAAALDWCFRHRWRSRRFDWRFNHVGRGPWLLRRRGGKVIFGDHGSVDVTASSSIDEFADGLERKVEGSP